MSSLVSEESKSGQERRKHSCTAGGGRSAAVTATERTDIVVDPNQFSGCPTAPLASTGSQSSNRRDGGASNLKEVPS